MNTQTGNKKKIQETDKVLSVPKEGVPNSRNLSHLSSISHSHQGSNSVSDSHQDTHKKSSQHSGHSHEDESESEDQSHPEKNPRNKDTHSSGHSEDNSDDQNEDSDQDQEEDKSNSSAKDSDGDKSQNELQDTSRQSSKGNARQDSQSNNSDSQESSKQQQESSLNQNTDQEEEDDDEEDSKTQQQETDSIEPLQESRLKTVESQNSKRSQKNPKIKNPQSAVSKPQSKDSGSDEEQQEDSDNNQEVEQDSSDDDEEEEDGHSEDDSKNDSRAQHSKTDSEEEESDEEEEKQENSSDEESKNSKSSSYDEDGEESKHQDEDDEDSQPEESNQTNSRNRSIASKTRSKNKNNKQNSSDDEEKDEVESQSDQGSDSNHSLSIQSDSEEETKNNLQERDNEDSDVDDENHEDKDNTSESKQSYEHEDTSSYDEEEDDDVIQQQVQQDEIKKSLLSPQPQGLQLMTPQNTLIKIQLTDQNSVNNNTAEIENQIREVQDYSKTTSKQNSNDSSEEEEEIEKQDKEDKDEDNDDEDDEDNDEDNDEDDDEEESQEETEKTNSQKNDKQKVESNSSDSEEESQNHIDSDDSNSQKSSQEKKKSSSKQNDSEDTSRSNSQEDVQDSESNFQNSSQAQKAIVPPQIKPLNLSKAVQQQDSVIQVRDFTEPTQRQQIQPNPSVKSQSRVQNSHSLRSSRSSQSSEVEKSINNDDGSSQQQEISNSNQKEQEMQQQQLKDSSGSGDDEDSDGGVSVEKFTARNRNNIPENQAPQIQIIDSQEDNDEDIKDFLEDNLLHLTPNHLNIEAKLDNSTRPKVLEKDTSGINLDERQFNISANDIDTQKGDGTTNYRDFQTEEPALTNVFFGSQQKKDYLQVVTNKVRTQKYTAYTWAFQSLFLQFKRVSNIYFLIISVLTFLSFSPKDPASMIGTFAFVLLFTMLKEAYEVKFISSSQFKLIQDFQRYEQDKETNNKNCLVLNYEEMHFEHKKWEDIHPGYIIKIQKDEQIPADTLLLYSSETSGLVYVDTLNLDGETNLKDKTSLLENYDDRKMVLINGIIKCEQPNENLERWEGLIMFDNSGLKPLQADIQNIALRGSSVRNTQYVIGIVVYTGMNTKIMKNHKKPRQKVSNIMRLMNNMLYTVFTFQLCIVFIMAGLNTNWINKNGSDHAYLDIDTSNEAGSFFIQLLVFWVAYSHMIPISLYVIIELLKLGISMFLNKDIQMYDSLHSQSYAMCRNSDLVEELGQIELVFSDKTGTLTQNKMIFRKCSINGYRFGDPLKGEIQTDEGMCISGIKQTIKKSREELEEENIDSEDEELYPYTNQFFTGLAICNTVNIEKLKEKQEISYKATSPDELALVIGAKASGIQLIDRHKDNITIYNKIMRVKEHYQVKAEFPFDQERKRQSILIKTQDKNYILYTKGADSVMMERVNFDKNQVAGLQEIVEEDLNYYSTQGLRTLMMANRVIMKQEYKQFKRIYNGISKAKPSQRQEKLEMLYDVMEQKLRYLGCSALEDRLQEGVPLTIEQLMRTDIRFFMLTGDKLQTAREIGRLCKLVQSDMQEIVLANMSERQLETAFEHILTSMRVDIGMPIVTLEDAPQFSQVVIVEGPILAMIFSDQRLNDLFFHLCIRSRSVICCRMSPKQKADIVNMFRSRGKWITLAIGDGANDVSMLNEAHIGIGITGQEGNQAARAADFQIAKFEYLMRLVLYHGRLSYLRVSRMICYYFYKNVILVFTEIYFPFYNGFSGQIFFLDWLPMMYNAIFTSWYCLFSQLLERDVNDQYSYKYPIVYKAGQLGKYFNYQIFWKWIFLAITHGALCFYIPIQSDISPTPIDPNGSLTEHWVRSTISFSVIIHLVFYKLLIETRHLNFLAFILGVFSLFLYYAFLGIGQVPWVAYQTQDEVLGVFICLLQSPSFWLQVIFIPFGCLIPDLSLFFLQQVFYATPVDTVISKQKFDPYFDFRIYQKTKENKEEIKARASVIAVSEQRKEIIKQRRETYFSSKSPLAIMKKNPLYQQPKDSTLGADYKETSKDAVKKSISDLQIYDDHDTDDERESKDQRSSRDQSQSGENQDNTTSSDEENKNINSGFSSSNMASKSGDGKNPKKKHYRQEELESFDDSEYKKGNHKIPNKQQKSKKNSNSLTKKTESDEENKNYSQKQRNSQNKNKKKSKEVVSSSDEESKGEIGNSEDEQNTSQRNNGHKKGRDQFDESSRSLNMSIRSNHGLVSASEQISRKNKKFKKNQNQSLENSEAEINVSASAGLSSLSYMSAQEIQGRLESHRKKQTNRRQKVDHQVTGSDQNDSRSPKHSSSISQEGYSSSQAREINKKRNKIGAHHQNERVEQMEVESLDQSQDQDQSMDSSFQDRKKLLKYDNDSNQSVQAKVKNTAMNFPKRIFKTLFGNNKKKMLKATKSAFDNSLQFKLNKNKDPNAFVADHIVNALISERVKAPDETNQQQSSAHPEFVKTLGHPLEDSPRKGRATLHLGVSNYGQPSLGQGGFGSDQGIGGPNSSNINNQDIGDQNLLPPGSKIYIGSATPGRKQKEKKYLQKYRNMVVNNYNYNK